MWPFKPKFKVTIVYKCGKEVVFMAHEFRIVYEGTKIRSIEWQLAGANKGDQILHLGVDDIMFVYSEPAYWWE